MALFIKLFRNTAAEKMSAFSFLEIFLQLWIKQMNHEINKVDQTNETKHD